MSAAVWKRCSRSFASPRFTMASSSAETAIAVLLSRSDGGGSDVALTITSVMFSRVERPLARQHLVEDQRRRVDVGRASRPPRPRHCSGAM